MLVRDEPNTHLRQPLTPNFDSETMRDWFGIPKDEGLPSTYSMECVRRWVRRERAFYRDRARQAYNPIAGFEMNWSSSPST